MNRFLDYTNAKIQDIAIHISGSKSESNRLLILQQWYPNLILRNVSDSDDTNHLIAALKDSGNLLDIGHAGTAMRFLTTYFSTLKGREVVLTGSERMQNRPIKVLVDALRSVGADISYEDKEGYPPLRIKGVDFSGNKVSIRGNVSSQYISSLLLVAPSLEKGLQIEMNGEITSRPYLQMTLDLLEQIGVQTLWNDNLISIAPAKGIPDTTITVESDWSSASYWYSFLALSDPGTSLELVSYRKDSLQGDSRLAAIYTFFGVETEFYDHSIRLTKRTKPKGTHVELDLNNAPDIAQTIAVTCFALGIGCDLTGLHTLKIKETDRLEAMKTELEKFGALIEVTNDSLHLKESTTINKDVRVATYNDHRMAMAFAPLAMKVPLVIEDAEVVTKSYIHFWEHISSCFNSN